MKKPGLVRIKMIGTTSTDWNDTLVEVHTEDANVWFGYERHGMLVGHTDGALRTWRKDTYEIVKDMREDLDNG